MLLKLLQAGQPILRQVAKSVNKSELTKRRTQELIDSMIETLRDAPGVGLAAPQVGEALRVIIVEDKAKYHEPLSKALLKAQGRKPVSLKVFVNPELEIIDSSEALFFEGCLSADGYVAAVPRAKTVRVKALDRHGKSVSYKAEGWYARILQHEVDHLDGTLFIDRMNSKSFMSLKHFNISWRKAMPKDINKYFGNVK